MAGYLRLCKRLFKNAASNTRSVRSTAAARVMFCRFQSKTLIRSRSGKCIHYLPHEKRHQLTESP
jgi:hypothetical protein